MRTGGRAALVGLCLLLGCAQGTGPRTEMSFVEYPDPFVELVRLDDDPPLDGALVQGRRGDWLIRNERMAVVVSAVDHVPGFSLAGGVILDAAPYGGRDVLREIFTYFDDSFPRQAVYETLVPGVDDDSTAVVLVATGRDSDLPALRVSTRYVLRPGDEALGIETTLANTGSDPIVDFELGDAIQWGFARPYAPGAGSELAGTRPTIPFLVGESDGTVYGWASPAGPLGGPHGGAWSDPIVSTVDLEPGETARYERLLFVGRGNAAEGLRWGWNRAGLALSSVLVEVESPDGDPVRGAEVEFHRPGGEPAARSRTGANGVALVVIPPGDYRVRAFDPGLGTSKAREVEVSGDRERSVSLRLEGGGVLVLDATDEANDPAPARWTLTGLDGTADPRLDGAVLGLARGRTVLAANGKAQVAVPAGRYRLLATRGPLRESWDTEVMVNRGDTLRIGARLPRLPVPGDWISADLHVHALPSPDSDISRADRLRTAVCEGLDWFVATDHGARTRYDDLLDTLDLAATVRVLVGEEVTTPRSGHLAAYPLSPGEPIPRGAGLEEAIARLRESSPDALIQVNHPRSGFDGAFDRIGFDRDRLADGRAPLDFDLLEVASGRRDHDEEAAWADWFALLEAGFRVTAVGNADSHRLTGDEVGYPRNVLVVPMGAAASGQDVLDALRVGRVMVTNGPLIELAVAGAAVGETVETTAGLVTARVRVVAPRWCDARTLTLYVGNAVSAQFRLGAGDGQVRFDEEVEIYVPASTFVVARVDGAVGLEPVVSSRGGGPRKSLSFTNPIWVAIPRAGR